MAGTESDTAYVELLHDLAASTNEASGLDECLLTLALRLTCGASGWPVGHALVSANNGMLRSARVWYRAPGYSDAGFESFRQVSEGLYYPPNMGLPGRVLATRKLVWLPDLVADRNLPRQALATDAGFTSAFGFPLRRGSAVVAVCEFYASAPQAPTELLVETLPQLGVRLGQVFGLQRTRDSTSDGAQQTQRILESAEDAYIAMDSSGQVVAWNPAAETLFGWPAGAAIGQRVVDLIVPPRLREAYAEGLSAYLATRAPRTTSTRREVFAVDRTGREFPIEITYWALTQGADVAFYSFVRDISARKQREAELEQHANYDLLTGLPNRKLLLDRIEQVLAQRDFHERGLAILFVDLDRFKRINDSLGHAVGDQVLVAVAGRLRDAVRPMDTVARMSGDEFVALCPEVNTHRDAAVIADRITTALREPLSAAGNGIYLTASVGIAIAEPGSTGEALLAAADTAMYRAKSAGRGSYELFDEKMRAEVALRLRTERELRDVVDDEQLELLFQPIVTAARGDIAGIEALVRWRHPERGLLLPAEFLPVAEEIGQMVPIGAWVCRELRHAMETWQDKVLTEAPLMVSLNLSARQLVDTQLVPMLQSALMSPNLDTTRIWFSVDITENTVMRDPVAATAALHRLKDLGFHIAADNFGAGYSSLGYLKRLPVDMLKIDRSFIQGIAKDEADRKIVHALVTFAHELGMLVVAQGVETILQAQATREAKVDFVQGFLYGEPRKLDELMRSPRLGQRF